MIDPTQFLRRPSVNRSPPPYHDSDNNLSQILLNQVCGGKWILQCSYNSRLIKTIPSNLMCTNVRERGERGSTHCKTFVKSVYLFLSHPTSYPSNVLAGHSPLPIYPSFFAATIVQHHHHHICSHKFTHFSPGNTYSHGLYGITCHQPLSGFTSYTQIGTAPPDLDNGASWTFPLAMVPHLPPDMYPTSSHCVHEKTTG